jgi:hypothetical protein
MRYMLQLLETGAPPEHSSVRVARVSNDMHATQEGFIQGTWSKAKPYRSLSIISVSGLLAEVMIGEPATIAEFVDVTRHDDRLVRLWPPQITSQHWPPEASLTLVDSQTFRAEWEHPPEIVRGRFPAIKRPRGRHGGDI